MLVITRRNNEEFIIGDDIRVRVVSIRGQRVQIGVEAPLDVAVRRLEPPAEESRWVDADAGMPVETA